MVRQRRRSTTTRCTYGSTTPPVFNAKEGIVEGFEVAGSNGVFLKAKAQINGDTVTVSSPSVPSPVYVRYAWPNFPQANLYNGANLPASTFTTLEPPTQP